MGAQCTTPNETTVHATKVDSVVHFSPIMGSTPDLDEIFICLKQMESTVLGLKQLRGLIGKGAAREMLDALIVEAEAGIAEIRKRINQ